MNWFCIVVIPEQGSARSTLKKRIKKNKKCLHITQKPREGRWQCLYLPEEIQRQARLERRRPQHVQEIHQVHEALGVHWHQVDDLSNGRWALRRVCDDQGLRNKRHAGDSVSIHPRKHGEEILKHGNAALPKNVHPNKDPRRTQTLTLNREQGFMTPCLWAPLRQAVCSMLKKTHLELTQPWHSHYSPGPLSWTSQWNQQQPELCLHTHTKLLIARTF